jgi:hypothetical protein
LKQAEDEWPVLQAKLEALRAKIVRKGAVIVNLTGDKKVCAVLCVCSVCAVIVNLNRDEKAMRRNR